MASRVWPFFSKYSRAKGKSQIFCLPKVPEARTLIRPRRKNKSFASEGERSINQPVGQNRKPLKFLDRLKRKPLRDRAGKGFLYYFLLFAGPAEKAFCSKLFTSGLLQGPGRVV
jgi:hypothetical protein